MKSALARSLHHFTERLTESFTVEEYSHRQGFLQQLDTRVKCITILGMMVTVSFVHHPVILLGGYLMVLGLALASRIPARYFITRVWLPLPLLAAIVALPALFTTPGQPLLVLPFGLAISSSGALSAVLLYLRVGTSVSLALLLMLTTSWASLLRALAILHVPDILVLLLSMTYRYIYVLLRMASDMLLSRCSRSVGKATPRLERAAEGAILGSLLVRSYDMSNEIYLAMRSRGFIGYARTLHTGRIGWRDYAWMITTIGLCTVSIIVSR